MEPVFAPENRANTEVTSPASTTTHDTSNKGGRPNGSTPTAMNVRQYVYTEALDECVIEVVLLKDLAQERSQTLGKKCRVPRGAFDKAIKKCVRITNWKDMRYIYKQCLHGTKHGTN
jgi:hypothetical protein